ncbi:MAG: hypothetical protein JSV88_02030 [Candidatus Aminicenantes bacterium]|nr:MAG: hypothetical protein JSV88_02030 [Candidatus Aminicenantes bacterium]
MNSTSQAEEVENLEAEIFSCLRSVINAVEIYSSKLKDKSSLRGDNGLVEVEPSVLKKEKI